MIKLIRLAIRVLWVIAWVTLALPQYAAARRTPEDDPVAKHKQRCARVYKTCDRLCLKRRKDAAYCNEKCNQKWWQCMREDPYVDI
jgi:hypothetical protein